MAEEVAGPLRLRICNRRGLHARASARFVTTASGFEATLLVSRAGGEEVEGTSILGLMMLAAAKGDEITVTATGTDAGAALEAIRALVESRFGEDS